jgi:hypothetical protein
VVPAPKWTAPGSQWPQHGSPWNDHKNATEEKASLGYGILDANAGSMVWTFKLSEGNATKDSLVIYRHA